MYLPKFKITAPLFTFGSEFIIAETGRDYTGTYFKTSKGDYYTGSSYSKKTSLRLIQVVANENSTFVVPRETYDFAAKVTAGNLRLKTTQAVPAHTYIPDYAFKIDRRFFAKSKTNNSIIEIDTNTYKELYGKTPTYHYPSYDVLLLNWDLSSPVEDSKNGSYIIEGSKSKNRKQVLKADKTFKGIYDYLVQNQQL